MRMFDVLHLASRLFFFSKHPVFCKQSDFEFFQKSRMSSYDGVWGMGGGVAIKIEEMS